MSFTFEAGLEAVRHMQSRASCRSFSDRPVPADLLQEILSAGLHSASGGSLQPWSIIIERNKSRCQRLSELCGGQKFIAEASINLLFLLDWHRYRIYAGQKDAPFTCHNSFKHFLTGVEDVMCAAQTIETACHLLGLGSCYVGTVSQCGAQLAEMFSLPEQTYPIVMLSIGWPAVELRPAPKLDASVMVFESAYPKLTPDQIHQAYETKLKGRTMALPAEEPYRGDMLQRLRSSLSTSYSKERVEAILRQADEQGFINETQRRFGLHYHAHDTYHKGGETIEMLRQQGLRPFDVVESKKD